jgi:hypothetical protein
MIYIYNCQDSSAKAQQKANDSQRLKWLYKERQNEHDTNDQRVDSTYIQYRTV